MSQAAFIQPEAVPADTGLGWTKAKSAGGSFWGAASKKPASDVPTGRRLMGIWRAFGRRGVQSVMRFWVVRRPVRGIYPTGGSYYEMPSSVRRDHPFLMRMWKWMWRSARGRLRRRHVNVRMTFSSSLSLLC